MRWLPLVTLALASGCFKAWDVGGPWACADGGCPTGLSCDDAVCCVPGGSPECPTLPAPDGTCPQHSSPAYFFRDSDGDGDGDPADRRAFCRAPVREAWVLDGGDCDDHDSAINSGAAERCNAIDDDCDGVIDDGLQTQQWFRDDDGDGYGHDCDAGGCLTACAQPDGGYVPRGGDCDDATRARHPGAAELCSNVDENCNGVLDDAPFSDVQNPGEAFDPRWDCDAGLLGECKAASVQCLATTAGPFAKVCVPHQLPSTDVCDDGKDSDCSGVADDPPGCGGPAALLELKGAQVQASAHQQGQPSTLTAGCYSPDAGTPMSWLSPSWIGVTAKGSVQVWTYDAPPGTWWDLRHATALRLPVRLGWVGSGSFTSPGPAVQLCGERDDQLLRFEPASGAVTSGNQVFTVPLAGSAAWTRTGNGLDPAHVTRLQVLLRAEPPSDTGLTFTFTFRTDAGTLGFQ